MLKSLVFSALLLMLLFIVSSCCKGDPCADYLQVEDVFLKYDSSFQEGHREMTIYPSIAYELRKDLRLTFHWEIGAEIYEGEQITLEGEGVQQGTLTISNPGCSIEKKFSLNLDLNLVTE